MLTDNDLLHHIDIIEVEHNIRAHPLRHFQSGVIAIHSDDERGAHQEVLHEHQPAGADGDGAAGDLGAADEPGEGRPEEPADERADHRADDPAASGPAGSASGFDADQGPDVSPRGDLLSDLEGGSSGPSRPVAPLVRPLV